MSTAQHVDQPHWLLARLLSLTVAIQCAGLLLSALRDTTAVSAVLFVHLRMSEGFTLFVDQGAAIVALAISLAAVTGRVGQGLLWVGGWFLLIACAEMYDGGEPYSQWAVAAHATRIALPIAAYAAARMGTVPGLGAEAFRWTLRVAIALTFVAHGYEALAGHPRFIDYILSADRKVFSLGLTELRALDAMSVIGLVDMTIALLVVTGRDFRFVLVYAAGWGAITALARIVHMDVHYPQAMIRVANAGMPLALLLSGRDSFPRQGAWALRIDSSELRPVVGILCTVVAAGALCVGLQSVPSEAADIMPGQLRVIWLEKPSAEAVVAWTTDLSGTSHQVLFDTVARNGATQAYRFSAPTRRDAQYTSGSKYYHHALIDGLSASTTYYFVVVSDGVASAERHFVTAPRDEREIKLLYGGDSRTDRTNRLKINDLIRAQAEADPDIIAFAHGGDYVEDGMSFSQWNDWLDDFQRTVTANGRILPLVPARGNHEASGSLYGEVFAFPGINASNYFVSELSPQIAFIVLNSNASLAGDQRTFLANELDLRSQDTRWLLASYHQPAYPAVKSPGGALEHWVPLFEQYDVDLVCESDGHVLKRTHPMRDGQRAEDGVVYIGEGGLGVAQRTPISASYLAMARSAHHIQRLTFRPDRLRYEAITLDGSVVDSVDRFPRREGKALPARLVSATALSSTTTVARFDKALDVDFALRADLYKVAPTGTVLKVLKSGEPTTVLLTTSSLAPGQYTLSVNGLVDVDGLSVTSETSLVVAENDGEGTGMLDDAPCPPGGSKVFSGQCGCDVIDIDTDGDGVADCIDGCPEQDSKVKGGQCGCDVVDTDRDGDGIADCVDACPADATKASGACECETRGDDCADGEGGALKPVSGTHGCSAVPGRPMAGATLPYASIIMVLAACLVRRRRS